MRSRRLRVLLGAYSCQPHKGSEDGIGWNVALGLARQTDVWVLTREENRSSIEAVSTPDSLHFVYHDIPALLQPGKRSQQLHYFTWQQTAARTATQLHRKHQFDITHHITWNRYWMPSAVSLKNAPFVWGPVGGGEIAPKSLRDRSTRYSEWLRDKARHVGERLVRTMAQRASIAMATTDESALRMRLCGATDVRVQPAVALSPEDIQSLGSLTEPSGTPNFISAGRLVNWKGFHFGIRAFARARRQSQHLEHSTYWIIGSGPAQDRLKREIDELKLEDCVHLIEHLPRNDFLERLADSHALIHPSLHDSGGFVCLEAMAAGRPVLALALGGPNILVPNDGGILVPPVSMDQVVTDLATAITRIAEEPQFARQMGEVGKTHVSQNYTWDRLTDLYLDTYNSAVEP